MRCLPTLAIGLLLVLATRLAGQEAAPSAGPLLEPGEVEAQLEALEGSSLDDVVKGTIRPGLQAASEALERARGFREVEEEARRVLDEAPAAIEKLGEQAAELGDATEAAPPEIPQALDEQREALEEARAEVASLESELSQAEDELARVRGRPVQVAERLPAARSELSQGKLPTRPDAAEVPSREMAEWMQQAAERQALEAEVAMLEQEQRSQSLRERLAVARRDLLSARLKRARPDLEAREAAFRERQANEADAIRARIDQLAAQVPEEEKVTEMIAEVRELADDYRSSTGNLGDFRDAREAATTTRGRLTADFARLRRQFELGGLEAGAAQVLFEERRRLPNAQRYRYEIRDRQQQLTSLRIAELRAENLLANHDEFAASFGPTPVGPLGELLELRRELLGNLTESRRAEVRELAALDSEQRMLGDLVEELEEFLRSNLFWARSTGNMSGQTLRNLPGSLRWFFSAEHFKGAVDALGRSIGRHPFLAGLTILVVVALMLARQRLVARLKEEGRLTRRISTDSYACSMRALLVTILLAVPLPLLVGMAGFGLLRDPVVDGWGRGLGGGMVVTGVILFFHFLFRGVVRDGGLGPDHFRWAERAIRSTRHVLDRVVWVFIPALLIAAASVLDTGNLAFESLGRIVLMLSLAVIAVVFGHGMRRAWSAMNLDTLGALRPLMVILLGLLVVVPALLVLFAAGGWINTAVSLSLVFLGAVAIAILGWITYGLVLRWFMIKERRLAVEQVIRERKARREAAAEADSDTAGESEMPPVNEDEVKLDLDTVGQQTRRLLTSLAAAATLVGIWAYASAMIPESTQAQQGTEVPAWVPWIKAGLVIWIGTTVIRNLPGLLELAGLRRAAPDSGTRFAIATIAQYAATALIAVLVMQIVDLDLAQFGWIAAALSVGLGFGLQEVVANFVCGIILLFERPIRVGDVVVVDNVSGTVAKIRMRATTITNWDREDYVVPNKNFITGSLLNCTLSSKVNRVNLPVGIAYGSDVARALEILREVAEEHPLVMDEPSPFATFEAFGDSSLNLMLRCYLPDRDNRLGVITDLHREIDRRYREAEIEIPFPQRDLHLRSAEALVRISGEAREAGDTAETPQGGEKG